MASAKHPIDPHRGAGGRRDRETSIRRGVDTLLSLSSPEAVANGGLGVTKIADLLGREKSQISRTLATLAEYGLVDRDPDDLTYRLGWRIYALAGLSGERRLLDFGHAALAKVVPSIGERAYLSVLQGTETITVLSQEGPHAVQAVGWVGRTTPAYCTSVGKALLFDHSTAELASLLEHTEFHRLGPNTAQSVEELSQMISAARARGYATADQELEPGMVSVAAPVRGPHDRIVGALNASGPKYRLAPKLDRVGRILVAAAEGLSSELRGEPPAISRNRNTP